MPNEPTLSELTSISPDAGSPAPVIDNSAIVDKLNQGSRYHAEDKWRKYKQFLENKTNLFKNISDIQGLQVAPQDKEVLNKQASEILGDILKNPSVALGGKGYDEVQSKIAQFKSNSMLSKQNKLDDDANGMFMDRNPELFTDENKAKRENFWKLPLGSRQSVLLDMPTIFDEKTSFEGVLKSATQPYTQVVGSDGKEGEGYIESGNEINPNAIAEAWKLALQGQRDKYGHSIYSAVKLNYDKLPAAEKKKYENDGGGIEQYFADRGKSYVDAYFPEGTYEKTKDGNYRFGKKLVADPNYLGKERLDETKRYHDAQIANNKATLAVRWANVGLAKARLNKDEEDDLLDADSSLHTIAGYLNNPEIKEVSSGGNNLLGIKKKSQTLNLIGDEAIWKSLGLIDKDGVIRGKVNYDKEKDKLSIVNFKSDGSIKSQEPLDKRTFISKVIDNQTQGTKSYSGSYKFIEKGLQKSNNNLYELTQKINVQPENNTPSKTQPTPDKKTEKKTVKGLPILE